MKKSLSVVLCSLVLVASTAVADHGDLVSTTLKNVSVSKIVYVAARRTVLVTVAQWPSMPGPIEVVARESKSKEHTFTLSPADSVDAASFAMFLNAYGGYGPYGYVGGYASERRHGGHLLNITLDAGGQIETVEYTRGPITPPPGGSTTTPPPSGGVAKY